MVCQMIAEACICAPFNRLNSLAPDTVGVNEVAVLINDPDPGI